ncbi:MAG: hypothetical protein H6668_16340 [Ardenticatenaceae bacterium]|nr:hypothetical protein [Ardenticatenaceae bacterium]
MWALITPLALSLLRWTRYWPPNNGTFCLAAAAAAYNLVRLVRPARLAETAAAAGVNSRSPPHPLHHPPHLLHGYSARPPLAGGKLAPPYAKSPASGASRDVGLFFAHRCCCLESRRAMNGNGNPTSTPWG